jgi:predicted nucleic acid-binding protein
MKVLIDTNICLDTALQREPFAINAGKILSLSETNVIEGFVASHSFDTIFYLLKKTITRPNPMMLLKLFVQLCR